MTELRPSSPALRPISALALLALALSLAVAGMRIHTAWVAAGVHPGTAETSGCEEESWLSLWNRLHDRAALRPVTATPFNYAYFNWAFYESYGAALRSAGAAEHPTRIIRGGRLITTAWVVTGLILLAALLRSVGAPFLDWPQAFFWAGLAFLGPLAGWFVTTVRPDFAAIALETLGLFCAWQALRRTDRFRCLFTLLAGLSVYAAWAFKPSFVGVMSGIGLCYLIGRRWRSLGLYCAVVWGCTGLTFLFGGETYREVIWGTVFHFSRFDLATGWGAARHALLATSPIWVALGLLLAGRNRRLAGNPAAAFSPGAFRGLQLGLCCIAVLLPINALAAFKIGAWSYYYLPVLPAACIVAVALSGRNRVAPLATSTAAVLTIVLQTGLLTGAWGSISREPAAEELRQRWQEFSALPEPRFSDDLRLNLPWLNAASPPYVLAYDYAALRERGLPFAGDGIGGAIRRGELQSLYLRAPAPVRFDGASLADFTRVDFPSGFSGFVRPSAPWPNSIPAPSSP